MKSEKKAPISHLADLARIELDTAEVSRYERDITNILEYVDKISNVPASEEPLVTTISGISQIMRDDTIKESDLADDLLKVVPDKRERLVRVPKVL